jgi:ABC-2 type transport system permease protein
MRPLRALFAKELVVLFGSPLAYVAITLVVLVTALIFFDHLRLYNQTLFLYASTSMGGFQTDTVPDYVNLRDTVFFPVMETLGITLIGLVPLVSMRVFAEERARGTDELLLTTALTPGAIVAAKFAATFVVVVAMMAASFVYPAMAIAQGGLGSEHLAAVFLGLTLHAIALAAVGLACSAWTSSQLVAAVAGWALGFVLWDFQWVSSFGFVSEGAVRVLDALSLHLRYGSFAEGIVSAGHVAYFAALVGVAAAIARFSFVWRRVAGG